MNTNPDPLHDPQMREKAIDRHRDLAVGLLALPNLFLRSAFVLFLLYGMLTLVLITVVQFGVLDSTVALLVGIGFGLFQYICGPWIMDLCLRWLYTMRWVQPEELPDHLRRFVARVCEQHRMKFPSFGIIDDGAPEAFTYGHHPSNARIVISRGLMELLNPEEVEAVVAHEMGHARHWDMALMTLANLVPLLLYFIYDMAIRYSGKKDDKSGGYRLAIALGAYVLYIVSEYVVLWFSRTREYHADRFAGRVTGDPNALARALIKIAYGLAAQDSKIAAETADNQEAAEEAQQRKKHRAGLAALNIFDQNAAVALVMNSANAKTDGPSATVTAGLDVERVKGAMQWDLWSPWAKYYELHSTHPLVAKRLLYLGDQAAAAGQEPLVIFDRKQPESYWDDFLVDLCVLALPYIGLLAGLAGFAWGVLQGEFWWYMLGVAAALMGAGAFVRSWFAYRGTIFPHLTVAALLGHIKVSPVRPIEATLTGTLIGKGVPGLVYSEDFVMRDSTGIIFLDYNRPLWILEFFFGLLRANEYQGKEVRVRGWFRRAPVPYFEIAKMEVVDGSLPDRKCEMRPFYLILSGLLVVAGIAGVVASLVM